MLEFYGGHSTIGLYRKTDEELGILHDVIAVGFNPLGQCKYLSKFQL
jgi:hypothetical protein